MNVWNRLVVVDENGRQYDRTGVQVELSNQDDQRTLKVFVKPLPEAEASKATADHLAATMQEWTELATLEEINGD